MGNRKRAKLIQKAKEPLQKTKVINEVSFDESSSSNEEDDRIVFLKMEKFDGGLHTVSYKQIFKVFMFASPGGFHSVMKQRELEKLHVQPWPSKVFADTE
jgi:hypothetical protein